MASFTIGFPAAVTGRVFSATATKSTGSAGEEKGILDWILGGLQKQDQLLETDPVLQKGEEKNGGTTGTTKKNSVTVPANKKKNGGFGGLFAKK